MVFSEFATFLNLFTGVINRLTVFPSKIIMAKKSRVQSKTNFILKF